MWEEESHRGKAKGSRRDLHSTVLGRYVLERVRLPRPEAGLLQEPGCERIWDLKQDFCRLGTCKGLWSRSSKAHAVIVPGSSQGAGKELQPWSGFGSRGGRWGSQQSRTCRGGFLGTGGREMKENFNCN